MARPRHWLLLVLPVLLGSPAMGDSGVPDPDRVPAGYVEAFAEGDFEGARADLERRIAGNPTDKFLLYNLACAEAMLGRTEEAIEALLDALSLGFVDFHHMERDGHLDSIRGDTRYQAIIRNWGLVLDKRAEAELAALREVFGPEYTFERDEEARLIWASSFGPEAYASAREQVALVHAWARELLGEPAPDPSRSSPWVKVILPTTEDFLQIVGAGRVGGYYERDAKRLVSRDIGPSLRHEFLHVLHWRHMDRLGQVHPIWLQEGLACLPEDVDVGPGGSLTIRPSWRTNIAKRLAKAGALMPWERLFAMEHREFVERRPRSTYAQARSVAMFLHERGKLVEWYRAYVAGFEEDPTGLAAMERVFGKPASRVQRDFRAWLIELEEVADIDRPGPGLGVALSQGRGEGPVVDEIVAMNPGGIGGRTGNRLRHRDVIVAIDGRTVRTLDDLSRVLGEHEVGDEVVVTVRRGRTTREVPVVLVESD